MTKLYKYAINLLIILLLAISIFFFINFNKGIELTDESYLLLISLYPNDVVGRVNNSGVIGNFLLHLVNFDLYYFRILGALLLFISALALLNPLFKFQNKLLFIKNSEKNYLIIILILGSLNYYHNWVITPSYDLYNLIGILFFINGIIRLTLSSKKKLKIIFPISLIIFGGIITFICKPTTTFFLILIFMIWLLYFFNFKKISFILLFSSFIGFVVFLTYILFFYKNIEFFINDLIVGIELKTILDPRYSIIDNFLSTIKQIIFYLYTNFLFLLFFLLALIFLKIFFKKNFINIAFILIFIPLLLKNGLILSSTFLIFFYFLFDLHLTKILKINRNEITFLFYNFILILILYAYVVGTNTNVIVLLNKASLIIFLLIYSFVLKFNFTKIFVFPKVIFLFFILTFFTLKNLYYNFEEPRRYNSKIYDQTKAISLPSFNGTIYVDEITFNFISDFKSILKKNGWKNGNYLVDLTGREPGLNIISGAKFLTVPWWASAYVGSEKMAKKLISISNINKIKNSWFVTTDYKINISPKILNFVGLELEKNYKLIGKIQKKNKSYFIWKPKY